MTQPPAIGAGAPQTAITIAAPSADPAKPARRWLPLLAGPVVLALAGAAAFFLLPRDVTISGTVVLTSRASMTITSTRDCAGEGNYRDLHNGTQVVVTDPGGTVIGMTQLRDGKLHFTGECIWIFTVTVSEQDIYRIKVAELDVLQFTREDVEKPLVLRIGSFHRITKPEDPFTGLRSQSRAPLG